MLSSLQYLISLRNSKFPSIASSNFPAEKKVGLLTYLGTSNLPEIAPKRDLGSMPHCKGQLLVISRWASFNKSSPFENAEQD